jgi:DNA-directed RNA polymerase specialized sigma24 family protein
LVQETFIRLIVSWPRMKDKIERVEPFLYSTLKYAYLMESRRGRRFSFQDLTSCRLGMVSILYWVGVRWHADRKTRAKC